MNLTDFSEPVILKVAGRWRFLTVLSAPPLIALILWAMQQVVQNSITGKGNHQLWVTVLALSLFAVMILVFFLAVVWAFRARITLMQSSIGVRSLFVNNTLSSEQIKGYRYEAERPYLYLMGKRFPVLLFYFEQQDVLKLWLFQYAPDMDWIERAEENTVINSDMSLGVTEKQKELTLAGLRKIIKVIDFAIYVSIVIAAVNYLFFEHILVEKAVVALLILLPVILILLALKNRGHIRIDYKDGSRYPQIFSGTFSAGLALSALSLFSVGALVDESYLVLFVFASAITGLVCVFIDWPGLKLDYGELGLVSVFPITCFIVVQSFWTCGALYKINTLYDESELEWHKTKLVSKKQKKERDFFAKDKIKVARWFGEADAALDISVRREQFELLSEGQLVEVGVKRGLLEMPWVAKVKVPKA